MRKQRPILIVTMGGTVEAIDSVRVLTNLSRGGLGRVIVETALARGLRVYALVSVLATPPALHKRLTIERFTSARDLGAKLRAQMIRDDAAAVTVAMAAAVSDYRPARASHGKISSAPTTRILRLVRNRKLVDAIHRWRPDADLISFKLVGPEVSNTELLAKAARQRERTRSVAVVANRWPSATEHRAWLVTAETSRMLVGRNAIAAAVVDLAQQATPATSARDRKQKRPAL